MNINTLEFFLGDSLINRINENIIKYSEEGKDWQLMKISDISRGRWISDNQKNYLIAHMYRIYKIFVWDDTEVQEKPFYKYVTGRSSRPFIPLSQKELTYLCNLPEKDIEIVAIITEIKEHLKSRNFNAAKALLPRLGKLNKQDYHFLIDGPDCILLKLFNINIHDIRSETISKH